VRPRPRRALLLVTAAALLRTLSLPGVLPWEGAGILVLLAVALRLRAWEAGLGPRGDYLGGFLWFSGCLAFTAYTSWILPLGAAGPLALWWVLEGFLWRRLRSRTGAVPALVLAGACTDFWRGVLPMGGMPWGQAALGLAGFPGILPAASVLGEEGVSLLVLLAGAGCARLLPGGRRPREAAGALGTAGAFLAGAALLAPSIPRGGAALDCLALQPNLGLREKNDPSRRASILERHLELQAAAFQEGGPAECLIWAETLFPVPALAEDGEGFLVRPLLGGRLQVLPAAEVRSLQAQVARAAAATGLRPQGWFLTGAHLYRALPDPAAGEFSPRTSETLVFDAEGRLLAHAPKTELVPFGEALPFGRALPGHRGLALEVYERFLLLPDFERGALTGPLRLRRPDGDEVALGTAICWENQFPAVFRRLADRGAEAFLILSNEAWYGTGFEMDQMLAATRFRAAETGRAILRATNTGLTVLVGPRGEVRDGVPRGRQTWLRASLSRVPGGFRTPWQAWGHALPFLASLLGPLLALLGSLWPRPEQRDRPPDGA